VSARRLLFLFPMRSAASSEFEPGGTREVSNMAEAQMERSEVIAIVNSSDDTVEMVRECLYHSGFTNVVTAHIQEIRDGETDFLAFVERHQPRVFIYDISIPYDRNWRFLQLLMTTFAMRGRRVIVTTTNKRALDELVGPTGAIEVIGKPYDLDQIVKAVRTALE
jgi:DNA-binding NarL/FixJ family response regulator